MGDARWACPDTLTCPHDMQHFVFYTVHSLLSFYYVPAIFYYFLSFLLILIISCLCCSFSDSSTILIFNVDLPLSYFSTMISVISILLSCLSFPPSSLSSASCSFLFSCSHLCNSYFSWEGSVDSGRKGSIPVATLNSCQVGSVLSFLELFKSLVLSEHRNNLINMSELPNCNKSK